TSTQKIIVLDTNPPSITCPTNVTTFSDTNKSYASLSNFSLGTPTTSDNCSSFGLTVTSNAYTLYTNVFPIGTSPVTWTVTDSSGNTATCQQSVIVLSRQPPVVFTNADFITNNLLGFCLQSNINLTPPGATSSCTIISVTNNYGSNNFSFFNVGTNI